MSHDHLLRVLENGFDGKQWEILTNHSDFMFACRSMQSTKDLFRVVDLGNRILSGEVINPAGSDGSFHGQRQLALEPVSDNRLAR